MVSGMKEMTGRANAELLHRRVYRVIGVDSVHLFGRQLRGTVD